MERPARDGLPIGIVVKVATMIVIIFNIIVLAALRVALEAFGCVHFMHPSICSLLSGSFAAAAGRRALIFWFRPAAKLRPLSNVSSARPCSAAGRREGPVLCAVCAYVGRPASLCKCVCVQSGARVCVCTR